MLYAKQPEEAEKLLHKRGIIIGRSKKNQLCTYIYLYRYSEESESIRIDKTFKYL